MVNLDISFALKTIAKTNGPIMVVSPDGKIRDLIPLPAIPDIEILKEIGEKNKDCAFQGIQKSNLTENELRQKVKSLVETIKYARTHKLKPGINIPKKTRKEE